MWNKKEVNQREDLFDLPEKAGVYVIYVIDPDFDGIKYLCYVGSTENIKRRMKEHIKTLYHTSNEKPIYLYDIKIRQALDSKFIQSSKCTFLIKYKVTKRKGQWLMTEYRLIERIQPIGNIRKSKKIHTKINETIPKHFK